MRRNPCQLETYCHCRPLPLGQQVMSFVKPSHSTLLSAVGQFGGHCYWTPPPPPHPPNLSTTFYTLYPEPFLFEPIFQHSHFTARTQNSSSEGELALAENLSCPWLQSSVGGNELCTTIHGKDLKLKQTTFTKKSWSGHGARINASDLALTTSISISE